MQNGVADVGFSSGIAIMLRRLLLLLLCWGSLPAGAQTREARSKALFVYHLAHFVEWPASALGAPGQPFVIGVLGNEPFGKYLSVIVRNERLGGRRVVIKQFASADDIGACHILYAGNAGKAVIEAVAGQPVLTVGDAANFIADGGMIRLSMQRNRLQFYINPGRAKAAQLSISSKLLRLAKISN